MFRLAWCFVFPKQVQPDNSKQLLAAIDEINAKGWDKYPTDERLRLCAHPSMASRYMISIGGLDARQRHVIRNVL